MVAQSLDCYNSTGKHWPADSKITPNMYKHSSKNSTEYTQ